MMDQFVSFLIELCSPLSVHAPALLVVVPLIASGVCAFLPNGRLAWLFSVLITGFSTLCSIALLAEVHNLGTLSYAMGGWQPPLGIEFRIDALNGLILLLVCFIGLIASIFSWPTVNAEIRAAKHPLFYAAYLICFTGLAGVAITGDAFNLFVFLEISSIATYVLVGLGAGRDRRALPAAFNYLIMGTIGATFFVIGVGFLYGVTGTLNMVDLQERLLDLQDNRAVLAGFAFIVVGLGIKAAMWPLHQWLPNAYAYSPSFVTVFLSATATKVALYALVRFVFVIFGYEFSLDVLALGPLFTALALAAMVICSFQAVFQTDVRRMLAYSSVAQVGYMLLGISLGTLIGVSAGLFHLVNHALMKGALFIGVAGIVLTYQGTRLDDFNGVGRSAPWTMTAFAICALSLIGVPLTAGFQSKLVLLQAVFEQGWWWAAALIVFSSVLAVIYMGRVLEAVFFKAPTNPQKIHKEAPLLILLPLWVLALANLYIGVQSGEVLGLTEAAAKAALGGVR
ncbi:MAG: monovalent cation/H+ antiporter subunit D family protein [Pseudomonadota bacterium]